MFLQSFQLPLNLHESYSNSKTCPVVSAEKMFTEPIRLALNAITFSSALKACEIGSAWQSARLLLHHLLDASTEPNLIMYNTAINAFGKGARWQDALELFQQMHALTIQHDIATCSSAADALGMAKKWQESLAVVQVAGHFAESVRRGLSKMIFSSRN